MNGIGAEPRSDSLIVLIPSPLLGPYSWSFVHHELAERGWDALVSVDLHDPVGRQPCWRRTVGGVEATLRDSEEERPVVLVAHSGAGPLLPAVGAIVRQPIAAYVFVDAGLPSGGTSRLEAIATEDATSAAELGAALDAGRRFPAWTDKDLGQLVPEPDRRQALLDELRPRGRDYWTEELPDVSGWPDAPCGYLTFSPPYLSAAEHAYVLQLTRCEHEVPLASVPVPFPAHVQRLLDALGDSPAFATTPHWSIVGWNRAYSAFYPHVGTTPEAELNLLWLVFTDPYVRELLVDWPTGSRRFLTQFRAEAGPRIQEPAFAGLVERLSQVSEHFRLGWASHDVEQFASSQRRFEHPRVGTLLLEHHRLDVSDSPNLHVVVYTAAENSDTAAKLARLVG